ncbi:MAG TPA: DUF6803 family protein [Spirochaetota bacterium]
MEMTHYMELLSANQPWNLLIFMAGPVLLAETLAISELYLLFTRNFDGLARKLNRISGLIAGIYFLGVFIYLFKNVVIPVSTAGEWRTFIDVLAVGFYLSGVVPLFGMTLLESGIIARKSDRLTKLKIHAVFVAIFLVVAHVAMIAGMMSPAVVKNAGGAMHM